MSESDDVCMRAAGAAASLRAVLESVDAGELEAGPGQRAYLEGAMDALEALVAGVDPSDLRKTTVYRKVES